MYYIISNIKLHLSDLLLVVYILLCELAELVHVTIWSYAMQQPLTREVSFY